MAKGITERQWLNLVIIIISALILAFMLLGRFLNVAVDQSSEREQQRLEYPPLIIEEKPHKLKLTMIDFGLYEAFLNSEDQWVEENKVNHSAGNNGELSEIAKRWEMLLSEPFVENVWDQKIIPKVRATVLLYFKDTSQPLIIKVEALNSKEELGNLRITFIATGKKMLLHDLAFSQLIYKAVQ